MSDVESIKAQSGNLRGSIAASLQAGGSHFDDGNAQLIKFHGIYQGENRDLRQERKKAGLEPAYQFMVRTRVPGGALGADQYLVHDDLAERFGDGTLRVTTRQGFQLHGIVKRDLRATIAQIDRALLSTLAACGDVNRNVMCCPAPPKSAVQAEAHALAGELALHFTPRTGAHHEIFVDGERVESRGACGDEPDPIYGTTFLPRKFKMGVALCGDNCIDVYTQDVAFAGIVDGERLLGYTVLVGGGLGMTHGKTTTYPRLATPLCFVEPSDAVALAQALLTTHRDHGDRTNRKHARFKYLVEERGVDWIRSEAERRLGRTLAPPRDVDFAEAHDHLGWSREAGGSLTLGLFVENGRIKDTPRARLRSALRALVERHRPRLALTPQQNVLLAGIDPARRAGVDALFWEHGVATDPAVLGIRRFAMACPALPTCGLALADAERVLPAIVDEIARELRRLHIGDEELSVRMTGCPNGCARPYMGDVGFVGRSKGLYDIYLGGDRANTNLNWVYKTGVRTEQLVAELRPLLRAWRYERYAGETFGDYCSRIGRDRLGKVTA
jgi:sulfite reductase (ferredoxin)